MPARRFLIGAFEALTATFDNGHARGHFQCHGIVWYQSRAVALRCLNGCFSDQVGHINGCNEASAKYKYVGGAFATR